MPGNVADARKTTPTMEAVQLGKREQIELNRIVGKEGEISAVEEAVADSEERQGERKIYVQDGIHTAIKKAISLNPHMPLTMELAQTGSEKLAEIMLEYPTKNNRQQPTRK